MLPTRTALAEAYRLERVLELNRELQKNTVELTNFGLRRYIQSALYV